MSNDPVPVQTRPIPAVIPCAGRGTRLRPITEHLSKPMLPVGSRPVVSFALREAAQAGCDPIVVVCSPSDRALHRYLTSQEIQPEIRRVIQPRPRGLADALQRGFRDLGEPGRMAMLLPDNVALEGNPTRQLLEAALPKTKLGFGIIELQPDQARYFGNSGGFESTSAPEFSGEVEKITNLQPKGEGHFDLEGANRGRRTVGRGLLPRAFFNRVEQAEPDPDTGEIDDVPIYREMIESSFAFGVQLDTTLCDMGTPRRYLHLCHRYFQKWDREGWVESFIRS